MKYPARDGHFTIPKEMAEAIAHLEGVEDLVRVGNWQRAATLASMTAHGMTVEEIVALNIRGLRSKDTVAHSINSWLELGNGHPQPGQTVTLPTIPFPTRLTKAQDIQRNPGIVAEVLATNPAFSGKVMDRVADKSPNAARTIEAQAAIAAEAATSRGVVEDDVPRHRALTPVNRSMFLMDEIEWKVSDLKVSVAATGTQIALTSEQVARLRGRLHALTVQIGEVINAMEMAHAVNQMNALHHDDAEVIR